MKKSGGVIQKSPKKLRDLAAYFDELAGKTGEIQSWGLHPCMALATETIKDEINKIPVGILPGMDEAETIDEGNLEFQGVSKEMIEAAVSKRDRRDFITQIEKEVLLDNLGIAPLRETSPGVVDRKSGWDGYTDLINHLNPDGSVGMMPIPLLARSISSGSSFREPTYFDEKAEKRLTPTKLCKEFDKGAMKYLKKIKP